MSGRPAGEETVAAAAAGWFARERGGAMTAEEAAALAAWLQADPDHAAAYDAVAGAWAQVESARSAPEILAIRAEARRRPARARPALVGRIAAALLAVALVGGISLWIGREAGELQSRALRTQTYRTAIGERQTMTLRDGTVVTLNTDTVLRTIAAPGKRLVRLDRGQAFFRVAKDPRHPFMVTAAGRTITAVGTAFDVRVQGKDFEVTLVEGKIKVANPAPPPAAPDPKTPDAPPPVQVTEMLAGSRLVASAATPGWSVAPTDTARETSWLTGWLDFDAEPLGQVAAEFNRYSPRKIVVADPALAATPVSGRFEAGDVEAFARALASYRIARVETATPQVVRLAAP